MSRKNKILNPRRRFIVQALSWAGVLSLASDVPHSAKALLIENVTKLYSVRVARVIRPASVADVVRAVRHSTGKIAVGGGRFSMGGQVATAGGVHLDTRGLNQVVWFSPERRMVRVQAGMVWRDLQDVIDPHDLSVFTMQSYSNFSVGGSVSVNAHGRYVGHGPMAGSVLALQLVLADGRVVEASREQNAELFGAAIGGYGAVGVITEVELVLADNVKIARDVDYPALDEYVAFFQTQVQADPKAVMHNADLSPPLFDRPVAVTWRESAAELTVNERLIPRGLSYDLEQSMIFVLTESPQMSAAKVRSKVIEPMTLKSDIVQWRNREASLDVAQLEPMSRVISTYVLQEYFIPVRHFLAFARGMAQILRTHEANVLNVSIRHSPADEVALLPWAKEEVFSFVLFYKQRTFDWACREVGVWTRALIDLALAYEGRYYLPYQLHATREQFEAAYPEVARLRALKQKWDGAGRWSNSLWDEYL